MEGGGRSGGAHKEDGKKISSLYNQSHSQLYLWLEEISSGLSHPELCSRT